MQQTRAHSERVSRGTPESELSRCGLSRSKAGPGERACRLINAEMIKFIQVNLNHCNVVQDLLQKYAAEKKADVALMSDPHVTPSDCSSWLVSSETRRAAIWLASSGVTLARVHRDPDFVSA